MTIFDKKISVHLFIEIYKKGIRTCVYLNSNLQQEKYVTFPAQNESSFKETFQQVLNEYGTLSSFENITCSVAQTNFTMVPASLFSSAQATSLLQFSTSETIQTNEVDYARFNYLNSVGIFSISNWIKSVLILKFPAAIITHEQALFMRKLEQISSGLKQIVTVLHDEHALFAYLEAGNLKWQITSVIENADDALYHVANAIERMNLQDISIQVYAHSSKAKEFASDLMNKKDKIPSMAKCKWNLAKDSHLNFQLLCV